MIACESGPCNQSSPCGQNLLSCPPTGSFLLKSSRGKKAPLFLLACDTSRPAGSRAGQPLRAAVVSECGCFPPSPRPETTQLLRAEGERAAYTAVPGREEAGGSSQLGAFPSHSTQRPAVPPSLAPPSAKHLSLSSPVWPTPENSGRRGLSCPPALAWEGDLHRLHLPFPMAWGTETPWCFPPLACQEGKDPLSTVTGGSEVSSGARKKRGTEWLCLGVAKS